MKTKVCSVGECMVEIINEKNFNQLDKIKGKKYLRNKKWTEFRSDDMQRFTLLRYAIPELMGYKGEALVIDPDIFLVKDKLDELMPMLKDNALICRTGKQKGSFATSLMLLNCHKLQSWNLEKIIDRSISELSELRFADNLPSGIVNGDVVTNNIATDFNKWLIENNRASSHPS